MREDEQKMRGRQKNNWKKLKQLAKKENVVEGKEGRRKIRFRKGRGKTDRNRM